MRRVSGLLMLALLALAGIVLQQWPGATPAKPPPSQADEAANRPTKGKPASADSDRVASPGKGYVLSLSWSPAFCAQKDPDGESDQCEIGDMRGLVVHGLWPDGRAEYCDSSEPRRLPDDLARDVLRFMPSVGLARHEWEKHGSCSGLSQRDYFRATERAWKGFRQPDLLAAAKREQRVDRNRLLDAIARANPGLPSSAVALQCGKGGTLKEIRLCLDGGLKARPCPGDTRRSCSGTITILPPL